MAQQAKIIVKVDRYPSGDVWRRYVLGIVEGDLIVEDHDRAWPSHGEALAAAERDGYEVVA